MSYRKQCADDKGRPPPVSEFRLIAVTARFPRELGSHGTFAERCSGVQTIKWRSQVIRVVVLDEVSMEPRNALWRLFSGKPDRVLAGQRDYHWKQEQVSTVIQWLYETYRASGVVVPYTMEDFHRELLDEVVKMYPREEVSSRYRPEERLKGLRPEERLMGLTLEQRRTLRRLLEEEGDS